jgi:hypothetical protein
MRRLDRILADAFLLVWITSPVWVGVLWLLQVVR